MVSEITRSKVAVDVVRMDDIQGRIVVLRGVPVMLDFELAAIYGLSLIHI